MPVHADGLGPLAGVPFGVKDPQFHLDVGFFVFRLPFEVFLVHWTLVSLIVIFVVIGMVSAVVRLA